MVLRGDSQVYLTVLLCAALTVGVAAAAATAIVGRRLMLACGKDCRMRRVVVWGLLVLAIAAICAGIYGGVRTGLCALYQIRLGSHAATLAAALYGYQKRWETLPPTLRTLKEAGLYRDTAYELPVIGHAGGPAPLYLPVDKWNGKSRVVVAVTAKSRQFPEAKRAYIVLGDPTAYYVTEKKLVKVLARDDKTRQSLGDKHRWEDVVLDK